MSKKLIKMWNKYLNLIGEVNQNYWWLWILNEQSTSKYLNNQYNRLQGIGRQSNEIECFMLDLNKFYN